MCGVRLRAELGEEQPADPAAPAGGDQRHVDDEELVRPAIEPEPPDRLAVELYQAMSAGAVLRGVLRLLRPELEVDQLRMLPEVVAGRRVELPQERLVGGRGRPERDDARRRLEPLPQLLSSARGRCPRGR